MKLTDFAYEPGQRATPTIAEVEADARARELAESNRHLEALHRVRATPRPHPHAEQKP